MFPKTPLGVKAAIETLSDAHPEFKELVDNVLKWEMYVTISQTPTRIRSASDRRDEAVLRLLLAYQERDAEVQKPRAEATQGNMAGVQ